GIATLSLHDALPISEVKDIEIVCVPKQETQYDMFGTPFTSGRSTGFRDSVLALGEIIKGGTNGKYIQIKLPQGINLDLFIPDDRSEEHTSELQSRET